MSEAGRSINETVLHAPTHILRNDILRNYSHNVSFKFIKLMDSIQSFSSLF
jgi:hypothetical protein